ncbi:hypothetical protein HCJ70_14200 [Listeria booriae]|nr:hypothetical protein [Listeria booriae]
MTLQMFQPFLSYRCINFFLRKNRNEAPINKPPKIIFSNGKESPVFGNCVLLDVAFCCATGSVTFIPAGITNIGSEPEPIMTSSNVGTESTGITGLVGLIGSTGSTGFIGTTGSTGSIGSTGFTGSTGLIGSTGSTGFTGSTGSTGFTGSTGSGSGTTGSSAASTVTTICKASALTPSALSACSVTV